MHEFIRTPSPGQRAACELISDSLAGCTPLAGGVPEQEFPTGD